MVARADDSVIPVLVSARLRDEWTSIIAHDLRQPLNTIALSAQALGRAPGAAGDPAAREIENIRWAVRTLDRMISDLLDASLIEANRLSVESAPLDLAALARSAIRHLPGLVERCELRVEPGAEALVRADAGRVEQVLGNLLANAAKYGEPEGKIGIDLARCEGGVRLTVSNRGPGIPAPELLRVFDRFERGRDARRGRAGGLGLGLYIAKGLVEVQGGRMWAESTPGVLTRFHFTLPLELAGVEESQVPAPRHVPL
jgi:signal transduction histidine kinase